MVQLDKQWKEGKRVLVSQIQDKARELSGDKDFATRGWWGKFKKRYNINFKVDSNRSIICFNLLLLLSAGL